MKFLCKPHQGKEQPYVEALLAAGHEMSNDPDVVLIDFEVPVPIGNYAQWVQAAKAKGAALVAYPHGFALVGEHQLTKEPYECGASFVHGPGQKKLREIYNYPNPVHSVGYPGPRLPLEPRECNHVLFAPHHPLGNGWMPDDARKANTEAFRTLLEGNFMLSVRLIGGMEQNGVWDEPGVRYIFGQMDGTVDPADVAVCGGTYLANSLAAGIPCVAYNQEREWRVELQGQEATMVPDWQKHENSTRYPYDLSGQGIEPMRAAAQDVRWAEREEWMDNFMPPFDGPKFAKLVEEAVSLSHV